MRFALLGTVEVRDTAGAVLDLRGGMPRKVLAVLLAAGGRVVTFDAVVDAVWGDTAPPSAAGTLQTYVSRLRRLIEPDRGPGATPQVLVTDPQGYRLVVGPDDVDASRFEALADRGRDALDEGRPAEAAALLREAEALWRGPALAEYAHEGWARGLATRLDERRLSVVEQRLEAELALGRPAEVAARALEAVREAPLREGRWATLALALYRDGRQGEALRALDEARRTLVEELGLEPGRALRDIEARILDHDPTLDAPAAEPAVVADGPEGPPAGPARPAAPPVRPAALPPGPPFVGRRSELAAVHEALTEAAHATRFVVVEGEPGIGKTRLLEALAAEAGARQAVVAWGRTHESGAAPAYWPWLGALRALAAARPEVAPGLAEMLEPDDDPTAGEAGPAVFRLHDAVAAALEEASRSGPVVSCSTTSSGPTRPRSTSSPT